MPAPQPPACLITSAEIGFALFTLYDLSNAQDRSYAVNAIPNTVTILAAFVIILTLL